MDRGMFMQVFLQETEEYLEILESCLLELEENPASNELIDEIFRVAHTLKGMAATMGYESMTELTHKMEDVFELVRQNKLKVDSNIVSTLFKALDELRIMLEDIREGENKEYDISNLLLELSRIEDGDSNSSIDDMYRMKIHIKKKCQHRDAKSFFLVNDLKKYCEIIDTSPGIKHSEEDSIDDCFEVKFKTARNIEEIIREIEDSPDIERVEIVRETRGKEEAVKFIHSRIDSDCLRVDIKKLDSLMEITRNIDIYVDDLEEIGEKNKIDEMANPLNEIRRLVLDLESLVTDIRLQPLSIVFNSYKRMVRDLSYSMGKDIDFIIEGGDIKIDKTVITEIGEVLVHLIRNAVDHGIEEREDRLAKGKTEKGRLILGAYPEGNNLIIIVEDDGRGMDIKEILDIAEKKQISTEGLKDEDILNLIFYKGFSTLDEVTDVSGRGVGMDVVRNKIKSLGGEIDLQTREDMGSRFTIIIPLS